MMERVGMGEYDRQVELRYEALGQLDKAKREQDEAREVARVLFRLFSSELDVPNWLEWAPWLKERE